MCLILARSVGALIHYAGEVTLEQMIYFLQYYDHWTIVSTFERVEHALPTYVDVPTIFVVLCCSHNASLLARVCVFVTQSKMCAHAHLPSHYLPVEISTKTHTRTRVHNW